MAAKVSRGKVELNLSIQNVAAADTVVQVNWQLAKSYQTAMQAMSEKLDLKTMLPSAPSVVSQMC